MKKLKRNSSVPKKLNRRRTIAYFLFVLQVLYCIFWAIDKNYNSILYSILGYVSGVFIVVGIMLIYTAFRFPSVANIDRKKCLIGVACILLQFIINGLIVVLFKNVDAIIALFVPVYSIYSIFGIVGTAFYVSALYAK